VGPVVATQVRKPLGDILLAAGLITPDQLAEALGVQKASNMRLGEVLVGLGHVTETDVARVLAEQLRIPFVPEHEVQVDLTVARLLPTSIARAKLVLPLREVFGRLTVAMADPLDVFTLDEVHHLTKKIIDPVVCTRSAIDKAISQYERLTALQIKGGTPETLPGSDDLLPPEPDDAPVVQLVNELIDRALKERASDIHVEPSEKVFRIRFRIDGFLREVMSPSAKFHAPVVARIKVLAGMDISERRIPQDGRIELRDKGRNVDLRVSTLPTIFGEKVVMRIFDRSKQLPRLSELGFPPEVYLQYTAIVERPHGMVLVTGPTGSGKTTTLMSTLAYINHPEKNIVTVEDPVEYQLHGVNHVQVNPKAGLTFADGLRSILRQDPNIIMVGEIRDGETADIAVRSALTGHMVFSTLHTNDATGALTRLADMGMESYLIASSVQCVLAQRLVRRLCPHCREGYPAERALLERNGCRVPPGTTLQFYRAPGCGRCAGVGYSGRFPIFELLVMSSTIREMVIRQASTGELRTQAVEEGMRLLLSNGLEKALEGLTSPEEVFRVAHSGDL
jgi:type IV pilus assembly protein PilB